MVVKSVKHAKNKSFINGMEKAQRMNEFKKGVREAEKAFNGDADGKGWRDGSKLSKTLRSRITLAVTSLELKMKEERKEGRTNVR